MKNGKIKLKGSIKDILSYIYVLNILIIMPIEVLTLNTIFITIAIIKAIIFMIIIEKTNIFDEV